jgi:hypothetical protein
MDYFAGLDVSVKETSVCIVDDTGKIVRETRVASEPEALLQVLTNTIYRFKRVGLEAGRDRACTLKDPLPRSFIDLSALRASAFSRGQDQSEPLPGIKIDEQSPCQPLGSTRSSPEQRTAGPLTGRNTSIYRSHSTNIFLNHAQMDSESLQIDFEWACNLEQPHGRFNFGDSCLILDESASVCALSEFAFDVS